MNAKNLLESIERNVGDVINNIDLVMAANTEESQEHCQHITMSNVLTVMTLQKRCINNAQH
jgi:hypothetical protein